MTQLHHDLATLHSRRSALHLLGGAAAGLWLGGCRGEMAPMKSYPDVVGQGASGAQCVAFPGETEGPFPADGRGRSSVTSVLGGQALQRTDIRSSFGAMRGRAEGVPLALELRLVDVDNDCAPTAGRALYLWQCDAGGRYSLYNIEDQNYLRGLQVADGEGVVRFTSIVPGCYDGRFPHIHFELFEDPGRAASGRDARLTSQLAVPGEVAQAVYAASPLYAGSTENLGRVSLERDNVFGDNTPAQVRAQTLAMTGDPTRGYRGVATIGLTGRYGANVGA